MTFVKYPGGKTSELPVINKYKPKEISHYYEPFVGGGAVLFNTEADEFFINDKSDDLIMLYKSVKDQNQSFYKTLEEIDAAWTKIKNFCDQKGNEAKQVYIKFRDSLIDEKQLRSEINEFLYENQDEFVHPIAPDADFDKKKYFNLINTYLYKKMLSMKKLEFNKKHLPEEDIIPNIESGMKAGCYMYIRGLYNELRLHKDVYLEKIDESEYEAFVAATYVFIRETTYSGMFRFNSKGEFNVPYGGISYNSKSMMEKVKQYQGDVVLSKLSNTQISNEDFEEFLSDQQYSEDDFIFVDPPYDSEFSSYDNSDFTPDDHKRLADFLINDCNAKFMIVIKNTDFIESLYPEGTKCKNGNDLEVLKFDKKYMVSFMNRNNKEVTHLLIKNY